MDEELAELHSKEDMNQLDAQGVLPISTHVCVEWGGYWQETLSIKSLRVVRVFLAVKLGKVLIHARIQR